MQGTERDLEVGGQVPDDLTIDEVYALLGCSVDTLNKWRRAGLQSHRIRGRLRFLRRDLEAFLGGRARR